jgi:FecR protein
MRSRLYAPASLLLLFSALILSPAAARAAAADDTTEDEYEEHARVLRVSLLRGEVSLLRAGELEWQAARLNTPLVEGDTLSTGRDSRLEIQADSRNFIRVGPDAVVRVVTLRDEGIALSLSEGTATFRLSRFDKDREYFEVDAPRTTVAAERTGQYRIDVSSDGTVRVTVREDGRARVYSDNSGFELRAGRAARLNLDDAGEADWDLSRAGDSDEWDAWNQEREQYLASRLKYEGRERYYDPEVYGAEELDLYGDWLYTRDYGYVWRPNVTVVNNYNDWAPYRYGRWVWCNPYGWTWVADEDWGWAPYHYGRWVYFDNNWCWAPRGYGYNYGRARWRPALVAFVNIDFGRDRQVCWYPLTYGQRDPRGRWWSRRTDQLTPLRGRELEHLRRANPALLRAVTTAPARDFGVATLRARPAAADLAQRALASEPLRGRPPVTRLQGARVGGSELNRMRDADGREVLTNVRPAPFGPARERAARPTGAAARTPGVALDSELRRTRVFNNREPRVGAPAAGDAGSRVGGDDSTGAVTRRGAPGRDSSGGVGGGNDSIPRPRPVRTAPPVDSRPTDPNAGGGDADGDDTRVRRREPDARNEDTGVPRVRPARPRSDQPSVERPSRPSVEERPSGPPIVNRPEPRTRPNDEGVRMPSPRREEPAPPRYERPQPPERREQPPPRQEQPRQEAPRQEAPRREVPRQEAPRQESPRQEAPRQERPAQRESPPRQERPRPAEVKARQKNDDQP